MSKKITGLFLLVMALAIILGISLILYAPLKADTVAEEIGGSRGGSSWTTAYNATYRSNLTAGSIISVIGGTGVLFCIYKLSKREGSNQNF